MGLLPFKEYGFQVALDLKTVKLVLIKIKKNIFNILEIVYHHFLGQFYM